MCLNIRLCADTRIFFINIVFERNISVIRFMHTPHVTSYHLLALYPMRVCTHECMRIKANVFIKFVASVLWNVYFVCIIFFGMSLTDESSLNGCLSFHLNSLLKYMIWMCRKHSELLNSLCFKLLRIFFSDILKIISGRVHLYHVGSEQI